MTAYDSLASDYNAGRLGYANDIYNHLVAFGLKQNASVLDAGCGTGLASGPLIDSRFKVTGVDVSEEMLGLARRNYPQSKWVAGSIEKLPMESDTFDVAIAAQVFHRVDRAAAMAELVRVVRPGGIVAVWWKHLMEDDPVNHLCDRVVRDLGAEPPPSGLSGGFKEFYGAPLSANTLRVVPWRATMPLRRFMQCERSRAGIHDALGGAVDEYYKRVEMRLRETLGDGDPTVPLTYMHYMYLGRTQ